MVPIRPVSSNLLSALRGSHTITARARVVAAGQTGTAPSGVEIPVFDGQVEADGTAQVRASLDLTTDGTDMWPWRTVDLLAPYGNEVFVERGVDLGGGAVEWCSLGYYRIETAGQDSPADGPIRIDGKDRMQAILDARLLAPVQFASSVTYGAVVTRLVQAVHPSAVIEWDDSTDTATLGRALIAEEKRWDFIDDLVKSRGKIWYWDHRGILVIKDPPSIASPVWDVNAGVDGVLVSVSRELSRQGVYNAVVASGEATGTDVPVRAVAVNRDPASPTYFYGPFGPVPMFYSSPFLRTTEQAASAAASLLSRQIGLPYNVDFSTIPNPALEPFDAIRLVFGKTSEVHVLEKVTIPLTPEGASTASTKEQTAILIGVEP